METEKNWTVENVQKVSPYGIHLLCDAKDCDIIFIRFIHFRNRDVSSTYLRTTEGIKYFKLISGTWWTRKSIQSGLVHNEKYNLGQSHNKY
jgi:hypothetical protein